MEIKNKSIEIILVILIIGSLLQLVTASIILDQYFKFPRIFYDQYGNKFIKKSSLIEELRRESNEIQIMDDVNGKAGRYFKKKRFLSDIKI